MNQSVFLVTRTDEVFLGTVNEIMHGFVESSDWRGISCGSLLSDIVADILCDPDQNSQLFAITLR
jgi:hypothetical protein